MPAWGKVKIGDMKAMELRQCNLSSHATILRAIGAVGADLMREFPTDWKLKLGELASADWKKSNRDWENVCMVAGSVISNRQSRTATKVYLKRHLGLALSAAEARSLPEIAEPATAAE